MRYVLKVAELHSMLKADDVLELKDRIVKSDQNTMGMDKYEV